MIPIYIKQDVIKIIANSLDITSSDLIELAGKRKLIHKLHLTFLDRPTEKVFESEFVDILKCFFSFDNIARMHTPYSHHYMNKELKSFMDGTKRQQKFNHLAMDYFTFINFTFAGVQKQDYYLHLHSLFSALSKELMKKDIDCCKIRDILVRIMTERDAIFKSAMSIIEVLKDDDFPFNINAYEKIYKKTMLWNENFLIMRDKLDDFCIKTQDISLYQLSYTEERQ